MPISSSVYVLQLHTAVTGKLQGGVQFVVSFATNNTDSVKAKTFSGCGGGVDVIGISATKSEQSIVILLNGGFKIVFHLAPFIAAQFKVDQIFTLDKQIHPSRFQQG